MRLGSASTARPDWYDRNLTAMTNQYAQNGVAPHAVTTRWSYTVPAGRKAYVGACQVTIMRETIAAPVGIVQAQVNINDGTHTYALPAILTTQNTVAAIVQTAIGQNLVITAGQILGALTSDPSTGGTNTILANAFVNEFDA